MENKTRKKNSLKNMVGTILSNVLTIAIGVIAQAIFIKILGSEYLGLNSLFSNIISMLAIVEMGIGSAIIYNLYKPIADNNIEQIKSLMQFYKKSYRIIALIVTTVGLLIIPLIPSIVDINSVNNININIYLVYLLFLSDTVFSYFLSYKRSILYANQKNYTINLIHMGYTVIMNVLQLVVLFQTKNYYLYLIVKIAMRLVENIVITILANKMYPYLKDKKINKLDKKIEDDIFKKVKALFFHKIGGFVINGTDNIIISKFLGLVTVGLYSNYYLIINSVQMVFNQAIQALTASIGNMLVTESVDKQFDIFKKIRFLNFWISTFAGISILIIMDSFITIWIGSEYILPITVLMILVFNFYQRLMRSTYNAFKEAAGIYYEDRFVPIIESILNIAFSIIFVKILGLGGVILGTIASGLVIWCYSYPKYVYKKLFNRSYLNYSKETLGYLALFVILTICTYYLSTLIIFSNVWLEFISNILIALIVPNIILLLIFAKNENFKYYLNLIKEKINK